MDIGLEQKHTGIHLQESKRDEYRIDAGKRAIKFEEKNRNREDKVLLSE